MIKDGNWELMEHDPKTGRMVWMLRQDDKTIFRTDYPVNAIIDENQRRFNASLNKRYGDGQVVASIPLNVYNEKLAEAQSQGDDDYISKFLNDRDNSKLRTFHGKL